MAERKTTTAVDDWKDVPVDDWKDVAPSTPTQTQEKPWIGQPRPENEGALSRIFHTPAYGVQDIGAGVQHMMQPGKRMQGAHEILSGVGQAGLPFLIPSAVAAPAATALGVAGGTIGAGIGKTGAEVLGASPEASNLAGDIGGIAGGVGAARYGPKIAESIMEHVPQGFNIIHPDVRSGLTRTAIGGAIEAIPGLPSAVRWPIRAATYLPGARQIGRGIFRPEAYTEEAISELPTYKQPPAENSALLDKISQGFGYKSFEHAPDAAKGTIQDLAGKMNRPASPPPPRPPTQEPIPRERQIAGPGRVFTPEPPQDTSGAIPGWSPTVLERETTPATVAPPPRLLPAGRNIITPEPPADTSGIIHGWKPTILEPEAAPAAKPSTVDISGTLDRLKAEQGIGPGKHLGEIPRGSYPERWDEGAPTPTVRSTMSKTKYIRVNPEDIGVHGGVENTPIKGPLNTPEKLKIARDLANEMKKSSKGGK